MGRKKNRPLPARAPLADARGLVSPAFIDEPIGPYSPAQERLRIASDLVEFLSTAGDELEIALARRHLPAHVLSRIRRELLEQALRLEVPCVTDPDHVDPGFDPRPF